MRSQVYSSATCLLASRLLCRIVRSTIGNFKKRRRWRQRKRHYSKVFAFFFSKFVAIITTHLYCQMLVHFSGIEILEKEHKSRKGEKSSVAVLCLRLFPSYKTTRLGFSCYSHAVKRVLHVNSARAKLFCLLNLFLFAVVVAKALCGEGVFHLIEAGDDLLLLTWV